MGIKTKNIKFKKIENKKTCLDIKKLYIDSFPIEERVDFHKLFFGVFKNFELYGLYKDKQLIGMAHFNNTINFVHLNYLAVDRKYQNQGYGTEIISWLKDKFNNKTLVVDVEELDKNALNNENRIKRKNFYNKNGFVDGKYCFMWEGVFMTYMNTQTINPDEFMNYIQIIFPTIKDITIK